MPQSLEKEGSGAGGRGSSPPASDGLILGFPSLSESALPWMTGRPRPFSGRSDLPAEGSDTRDGGCVLSPGRVVVPGAGGLQAQARDGKGAGAARHLFLLMQVVGMSEPPAGFNGPFFLSQGIILGVMGTKMIMLPLLLKAFGTEENFT